MIDAAIAAPPVNAITPALSASRSSSRREISRGCERSDRAVMYNPLILILITNRAVASQEMIMQTDDQWQAGNGLIS
jgi:hypothetical protein